MYIVHYILIVNRKPLNILTVHDFLNSKISKEKLQTSYRFMLMRLLKKLKIIQGDGMNSCIIPIPHII